MCHSVGSLSFFDRFSCQVESVDHQVHPYPSVYDVVAVRVTRLAFFFLDSRDVPELTCLFVSDSDRLMLG